MLIFYPLLLLCEWFLNITIFGFNLASIVPELLFLCNPIYMLMKAGSIMVQYLYYVKIRNILLYGRKNIIMKTSIHPSSVALFENSQVSRQQGQEKQRKRAEREPKGEKNRERRVTFTLQSIRLVT